MHYFFHFQLMVLLVLLTSVTHHVCSKAEKKFNFATGIVGSHISSWIQVIFVSVFLYFSFSSFEFWDASWYSSTTIWNCKNIRAWKINPTIIWKKYSINKNKSGVENLKTYWLYLWSENNYDKKKIEKLSSIIIYFRKLIVLHVMYYIQV